jgi:hypothetical protein
LELNFSDQVTLQLESAPDSPPVGTTNLISTWQNDLTAFRAERYWSANRLRNTAVSVVTGVNYGSANSPA